MKTKLTVFTLKANEGLPEIDEGILEALMIMLESLGREVVGFLDYEETEGHDDG